MADERAAEQPDGVAAERAVSQPHDKYFQRVFRNEQDAASLLRTCVPRPLADTLKWSTLTVQRGRFVADDWRGNETDMLYSVEREGTAAPVLVYVLLEHQSTPDRWLRLRLLGYCVQVWQQWHRQHEHQDRLPLLVPVVFFQGACRWEYRREWVREER
jgi:predicted transposase/invertase (TIGR01784 family)